MKICCSHSCAVTHHQRTATQVLENLHSPLFSAARPDRLTVAFCHSHCTYQDLLFIWLCSDPTTMDCNTGFGKMQCPLISAALQDRLTVALCHSHCTYQDLLFIWLCSDPTPMDCNTGSGKMQSPLISAALQDSLTVGLCHLITPMKICFSCSCAVTQHQCTATLVLENALPTIQCSSARQPDSRLVPLQLHLWRFAFHTAVQ